VVLLGSASGCFSAGTGKTTTAEQVARAVGFTHVNVGEWVKEKGLHSGWDEEHQCYTLDEDKVGEWG
jgi:adenylate kinase